MTTIRGAWQGRTYDATEALEESQRREEDAGTEAKLHCCALVLARDREDSEDALETSFIAFY